MIAGPLSLAARKGGAQASRLLRSCELLVKTASPGFVAATVKSHATVAALSLSRRGARFWCSDAGWQVCLPDGLTFAVGADTMTSDLHLISQLFEPGRYRPLNVEGSVVLDIGANIGDSAIYFVRQGARAVYAFEPFKATFERALANVRLNTLSDRITLFPAGLGASDQQTLAIYDPSVASGLTTSREYGMAMGAPGGGVSETVSVVSLNTAVAWCGAEAGARLVCKMDCEGGEFEVFADRRQYAEGLSRIDQLIVEYHWHDPAPIVDALTGEGFQVSRRPSGYPGLGYLYAARPNT